MKSVNKVILIGNVVKNPDIVQISEGSEVAKFTIAVNEYYKKEDGSENQITSYIDCEVWGGLVRVVKDYVVKGSRLYVEGAIRMDKWKDIDGKDRVKFKIKVNDIVLVDSKFRSGDTNTNVEKDINNSSTNNTEEDDLPF